jgi:hypothetical protein
MYRPAAIIRDAVERAALAVRWTNGPLGRIFSSMHLLYLDDSGSAANQNEEYVVLGGVSLFEAQVDWITRELDKLAESIDPKDPQAVEFHASEIFNGRIHPWDKMKPDDRRGIIKAVLNIFAGSYKTACAFACAIHKKSFPNIDHIELAFEDLCSRFDRYLERLRDAGDRQRGLLVLDETTYETSLQQLARNFRLLGTKWGSIRNLAEAPLFIDSKVSRGVQMADHIAYAVFRRYNAGDANYFDIIANKFDIGPDGIVHGLNHRQRVNPNCMCPSCLSRRKP